MSKSESFARHQASVEHISVGQVIAEGAEVSRDAIHIAVAPAVAAETLKPGQRVFLSYNGAWGAPSGHPDTVGIVDPFLKERQVYKGERFWLFVMPGTITGLRHVWTHPSFPDEAEQKIEERRHFETAGYEEDDGWGPCSC